MGATEAESKTVNIRNRDDQESQKRGVEMPLADAIEKLKKLQEDRALVNAI